MTAPVKKYMIGNIQVAVWENITPEGNSYNTVSLTRRYKTKNEEWKNSNSFRVNDLPKAIMALQKAYEQLALRYPMEEYAHERIS